MTDKVTLRLVIEVEYDLNGVPPAEMSLQLGHAASYLSSEGMLSGCSEAEVVSHDYWVEAVP